VTSNSHRERAGMIGNRAAYERRFKLERYVGVESGSSNLDHLRELGQLALTKHCLKRSLTIAEAAQKYDAIKRSLKLDSVKQTLHMRTSV
jgi:hypothetical protein